MDHSTATHDRVLLVEDNEDNRTIYSTVLRHLGYQVIEAVDGVQAVALARSEQPDLILMDISIPGIDGWEATRILREDSSTRDIPIIALTAHALSDDRERATKVGFSSYLAKPIEPNAVVAEVRRWIGKRGETRTPSGG
ncbi:MAG TPA: response regulator [Gemmatimonadaceae bacterium]